MSTVVRGNLSGRAIRNELSRRAAFERLETVGRRPNFTLSKQFEGRKDEDLVKELDACDDCGDDRKELFDDAVPREAQGRAKAVCAVVPLTRLDERRDGKWALSAPTLASAYNAASKERFRDQPVAAVGTAFLIAPNVVATAAHVANRAGTAEKLRFVFGFRVNRWGTTVVFDAQDVYEGLEIIFADPHTDVALIQLDRSVEGDRWPLALRSGVVKNGEALYIIGHPMGLPAKFADNATARLNGSTTRFNADLDVMQSNSGSPVFSAETHEVVGIAIEGPIGYVIRSGRLVSTFCHTDETVGIQVSHITNLPAAAAIGNLIQIDDVTGEEEEEPEDPEV